MKANEAITLDACLLALLHYGDRVPAELHVQIQQAKAQLSDHPSEAIAKLKSAIAQDERLQRLYTSARQQLVTQHSQQERAKSAVAAAPLRPSLAMPSGAIASGTAGFSLSLADLAVAILSSPDANYRAKAQQVLNQPKLQKQLEQASSDLRLSAKALENAANQLHPTKVAMMKKLENNFFTLDDVAYSLEIPVENAQRYLKSLWNEGYVRPTSSNLIKQIWLSLKGAPSLEHPPEPDILLKLTAKGHFYLHPGTLGRKRRFA